MRTDKRSIKLTQVVGISLCALLLPGFSIVAVPAHAVSTATSSSDSERVDAPNFPNFNIKEALDIPELSSVKLDFTNVRAVNLVDEATAITLDTGTPRMIAFSMLKNDSNIEQTLSSQTETRTTVTNTQTESSQTHGLGINVSAEAKFNVLLAETTGGLSASIGGEWSWGETKTYETHVARTLPAQNIKVPPKTTMRVSANLVEASFDGILKSSLDLTGNVIASGTCGDPVEIPIAQLLALKTDEGSVVYPEEAVQIADGKATVSSMLKVSGLIETEFFVSVEEVNAGAPRLISRDNLDSPLPEPAALADPAESERVKRSTSAAKFNGTTFTSLANHVACEEVIFGKYSMTTPDMTAQSVEMPDGATFVGGGYFISENQELFKGNLRVATNVISAFGYLNYENEKWKSLVDYITTDEIAHVNDGPTVLKTFHGLPKNATPIGSSYFISPTGNGDKSHKIYWQGNLVLAGAPIYSPAAWQDKKGPAVSVVNSDGEVGLIESGSLKQWFKMPHYITPRDVPTSITALPGGLFKRKNSFYLVTRDSEGNLVGKKIKNPYEITRLISYFVPQENVWRVDWVAREGSETAASSYMMTFDLEGKNDFYSSRSLGSLENSFLLGHWAFWDKRKFILKLHSHRIEQNAIVPQIWLEDDTGYAYYSYIRVDPTP